MSSAEYTWSNIHWSFTNPHLEFTRECCDFNETQGGAEPLIYYTFYIIYMYMYIYFYLDDTQGGAEPRALDQNLGSRLQVDSEPSHHNQHDSTWSTIPTTANLAIVVATVTATTLKWSGRPPSWTTCTKTTSCYKQAEHHSGQWAISMMSMITMMSVMANILIMVKIGSGTTNTQVSENH